MSKSPKNGASAGTDAIDSLENGTGVAGSEVSSMVRGKKEPTSTSRRDLLRRAGVAAGAAGGALLLLDQHRADAITGGNFILGKTNDADAPTILTPTAAKFPQPLFKGVAAAAQVALQGNASGVTTTTVGIAVLGIASSGAWGIVGQAGSNAPDLAANSSGVIHQTALAAGPPGFGSLNGAQTRDLQGTLWLSDNAGGWMPAAIGGKLQGLFTAAITTQPTLAGSDGTTWVPMSGALSITLTPKFHAQARVSANVDLWTTTSGVNQDIGVMVTGGTGGAGGVGNYPTTTGQPEAWKESGGNAGIFSPNAAQLEAVLPVHAGQAYTFSLVWKANHATSGTIWAGAGPIGGKFSPTRLTIQLVPDSHTNVGV
jgi:hypothetical protein